MEMNVLSYWVSEYRDWWYVTQGKFGLNDGKWKVFSTQGLYSDRNLKLKVAPNLMVNREAWTEWVC